MLSDLRQTGLICAGDRFTVLHGGRTNLVWRIRNAHGDRVLKLFSQEIANPLFPNYPHHETACLQRLAGTGVAPDPVCAGRSGNCEWVIYDHDGGKPWQRNPALVARVLADLHQLPAPKELRKAPDGSRALADQTREILSLCTPKGRRVVAAMAPIGSVPASGHNCFLHGDPVPGNILVDAGRAVLIDWQCPALGDPCEDLAIFTSPAMQHLYRGAPLSQGETDAFLNAYPDPEITVRFRALRPWYHWRMAAYCLWQTERGNLDYAPGLTMESAGLSAFSSST